MYLHEEYINRHKLDAKLVVYSRRSNVILRGKNTPTDWYALAFEWHHFDNHPGYFEVTLSQVLHNSWHNNHHTSPIKKEIVWQWDAYENNVLALCEELNRDMVAMKAEEHVLSSWYVYLNIYDSWLAQKMDQYFFDLVYKSFNPKESFESRMEAHVSAMKQLSISDIWSHQMLPLARKDSKWLVELINGW